VHLSPLVQSEPSLQLFPSGATGFEHAPLLGSQDPAAWHASVAGQVFVCAGVQVPDWQESPVEQALLSLQAVPFGATGFEHEPKDGSQVPAV
jgi:hypothetical protein